MGAGFCQGDGPIRESEVLLQYSSLQRRDRRGGEGREEWRGRGGKGRERGEKGRGREGLDGREGRGREGTPGEGN